MIAVSKVGHAANLDELMRIFLSSVQDILALVRAQTTGVGLRGGKELPHQGVATLTKQREDGRGQCISVLFDPRGNIVNNGASVVLDSELGRGGLLLLDVHLAVGKAMSNPSSRLDLLSFTHQQARAKLARSVY